MEYILIISVGVLMVFVSLKNYNILFEPPWWTLLFFYPGFIIRIFISRKLFRILMFLGGIQFALFGLLLIRGVL